MSDLTAINCPGCTTPIFLSAAPKEPGVRLGRCDRCGLSVRVSFELHLGDGAT